MLPKDNQTGCLSVDDYLDDQNDNPVSSSENMVQKIEGGCDKITCYRNCALGNFIIINFTAFLKTYFTSLFSILESSIPMESLNSSILEFLFPCFLESSNP